jgi:hypothetical protein
VVSYVTGVQLPATTYPGKGQHKSRHPIEINQTQYLEQQYRGRDVQRQDTHLKNTGRNHGIQGNIDQQLENQNHSRCHAIGGY